MSIEDDRSCEQLGVVVGDPGREGRGVLAVGPVGALQQERADDPEDERYDAG
jgi:hypothetical protein